MIRLKPERPLWIGCEAVLPAAEMLRVVSLLLLRLPLRPVVVLLRRRALLLEPEELLQVLEDEALQLPRCLKPSMAFRSGKAPSAESPRST
jgi:hypothetical protein